MARYWFLQAKHFYSSFSIRHKFEFLVLISIIVAVFLTRVSGWTAAIVAEPEMSAFGFSSFVSHLFLGFVAITIPLVHSMILPKRHTLHVFHTLPLEAGSVRQIFILTQLRYLSPPIIFCLLTAMAIIPVSAIAAMYLLITFSATSLILLFALPAISSARKNDGIIRYSLIVLLYFGGWALAYYLFKWTWQFDLLIIPSVLLLTMYRLNQRTEFSDFFRMPVEKRTSVIAISVYQKLKLPIPKIMLPLVRRNVLGILRNRKHLWLKAITLLIYILTGLLLNYYRPEQHLAWLTLFSALLIWEHYSHQFNEKFVYPEQPSFIKTMPLSYYQIWLAFFISELLYVIIILTVGLLLMILSGAVLADLGGLFIPLLIFAGFILATMNTIRLYFYDNPRQAGYAYHATVILCTVMSLNFFLVGPLVTLGLIVYFIYLSRKEYVR